jgi:uncharacterized membrane protein YwzB
MTVIVVALLGTSVALRKGRITQQELQLAIAGITLIGFALLASMFIVDTRGLVGRYDMGRFVRSTQFALSGVALTGLAAWVHGSRPRRIQGAAIIALVGLVLLIRVPSALQALDSVRFVEANRNTVATQLCVDSPSEIDWQDIWRNTRPELGEKFGSSSLFAEWRRDSCSLDT